MAARIQLGSIVEVQDATRISESRRPVFVSDLGQVIGHQDGHVQINLEKGGTCVLPLEHVKIPKLPKPGEDDDGTAEGFDLLLTPNTSAAAVGEELSTCLFEKGFCVLRIAEDKEIVDCAHLELESMRFERLPEELESAWLGSGKGKTVWVNDKTPESLRAVASRHSEVAKALRPYSCDALGAPMEELSGTRVFVMLSEEEEIDYGSPVMDPQELDKQLGSFLSDWRRTLVRAVHFLGKNRPKVELRKKLSLAFQSLQTQLDKVAIRVPPNTILLYRPDCFELTWTNQIEDRRICHALERDLAVTEAELQKMCSGMGKAKVQELWQSAPQEESQATLVLISSILSPAPQIVLAHVEGDLAVLGDASGPAPPPNGAQGNIDVMNCVTRLPGCYDNQWQYLSGLSNCCDSVVKIPFSRWDVDLYWTGKGGYDTLLMGQQTATRHQSAIEGVDMFDHQYFGIAVAEARSMDPVQRLVLEVGAQSLHMHGITRSVAQRAPIHAGFSVGNDKLDWNYLSPYEKCQDAQGGGCNVLAIIANRFSFAFNMRGPNFVCDTACSASLVSTHLAKLLLKETTFDPLKFHVSVGAHLCLWMGPFIGYSASHMATAEGRCFTFNATADGYLRGEGSSAILIQNSSSLQINADDDRDAILRATQAGQDGKSATLTAPNGQAQLEMLQRAIREAGVTYHECTVWECHGTGTALGDPIEMGAVSKAVSGKRARQEEREIPLLTSSSKANFGHHEGGAGMAALTKAVIQVKNAIAVPSCHLRVENPHLSDHQFRNHYMNNCYSYGQHLTRGHCNVSSFGFGGTNGHAMVWGESRSPIVPTVFQQFERKMQRLQNVMPPKVEADRDSSPDEWQSDWPDARGLHKGAKWALTLSDKEENLKWQLVDDGLADLTEIDDHTYFITGNFNEWGSSRMIAGDVPGHWVFEAEVPAGGCLQFRFQQNDLEEQVLYPATTRCSRKTTEICGPGPVPEFDEGFFWEVLHGEFQDVQIELFVMDGFKTLLWLTR